ncbi:MAG: hypothetical protein CL902_05925 [Dehalococcoidia bacterium]|nr:hypothetical protein [Dehalococcoidia bacterium]
MRDQDRTQLRTQQCATTEHLADSILPDTYSPRTTDNFSLENRSDQVRSCFNTIGIDYFEDALDSTEVAPVVSYVGSTSRFKDANLEKLGARVQPILDEHGAFVVDKLGGLFICEF